MIGQLKCDFLNKRLLCWNSVAEGVDHFKNGRTVEAMQMFNKALQVDGKNVEALVARGALLVYSDLIVLILCCCLMVHLF